MSFAAGVGYATYLSLRTSFVTQQGFSQLHLEVVSRAPSVSAANIGNPDRSPGLVLNEQKPKPVQNTMNKGKVRLNYPKDVELHVIGVYQGKLESDDGKPWWSKCGDLQDSRNAADCHSRYAVQRDPGVVEVEVSYNEHPIILALMAYSAVKWRVKPGYGVVIEQVILAGYHGQTIEGVEQGVPVHAYTYKSSPCNPCWQGTGFFYGYEGPDSGSHTYGTVERKLYEITGQRVASFQGKYKGERFSIASGMPVFSYATR
ncbi:hypothetical protein [Methylocaldum sp.]|uniref:hypothetical protein n=1 Tax=Methylocaldum sp. TaxID=1969727 RepID=UPI002D46E0E9|nr:hypothetical protein [Methylocaldum sp.]HYE34429.1 hypothetical protein [Methylocaldum sp.]